MKLKPTKSISVFSVLLIGLVFPIGELRADVNDVNTVEIIVTTVAELETAAAVAQAGDTIVLAEGTYLLTQQIEIKTGITYRGAGAELTVLDGQNLTRAFVGWGDRTHNNTNENPNDSGPKDWILEGMTIQNCVADGNDLFAYAGAAFNLIQDFTANDTDGSRGLSIEEADADAGAIRLPGPDGNEPSLDDDIHRFEAMDTNGDGELSEAELNAQLLSSEVEFGAESMDGGAVYIGNSAVGTIQHCKFLHNHTPLDGDDGGALAISGLSVITVNDCLFDGNYAVSSDANALEGPDGDGGHIKLDGSSASALTPGTTLIANRCDFLNGRAEDDGAAIQSWGMGSIIRLDACLFKGNTTADNGTVLYIGHEAAGELTVTNCIFSQNISAPESDRMCEVRRNSKFINCTFVGNSQDDQSLIHNEANRTDKDGDGIDDEFTDTTEVVNCLFLDNVVGNGDQILHSRNPIFRIAATNCLFFGNTRQDGSEAQIMQPTRGENDSVGGDPLLGPTFVPDSASPAIDAGVDPIAFGVPLLTDYNGNSRPQGAGFDIGAIEQ